MNNRSPIIISKANHRTFAISPLRRLIDALSWGLAASSFALLIFALLHILVYVFMQGLPALNVKIFTEDTQGIAGGLRNAIVGSVVLSVGALVIAVPIGISAGIYLSEHGAGWAGKISRFLSDVLVGVPSVVLGYFGYIALVIGFGWKFSLLAGAITLAIMMLPYIARTSELSLRAVPQELREAAYGLGCPEWRIIVQVLLPAARIPILTGLLMALAIALGETAPLLYTAGWSNYLWTGHFTQEGVGYLTYVIWSFIGEPYQSAHQLAYAAAFLITLMVLVINISARLLLLKWRR